MIQDLGKQARSFFRTVGPRPEEEFVSVKNCMSCSPKHTTYMCKKCDFQTWDKWRMAVHVMVDTRRCNAIMNQRAKEWSES